MIPKFPNEELKVLPSTDRKPEGWLILKTECIVIVNKRPFIWYRKIFAKCYWKYLFNKTLKLFKKEKTNEK
jgi:hypothetical protein